MRCPCQDCGDREIGCHAKCERYKEWKQARQDETARRRDYIEKDALTFSTHSVRVKWQNMRFYRSYLRNKLMGRRRSRGG